MEAEEVDERQRRRQETYKAGISTEENRRKREETTISIRKEKRKHQLKKRRQLQAEDGEEAAIKAELGYQVSDNGTVSIARMDEILQALQSPSHEDQYRAMGMCRKLLGIAPTQNFDAAAMFLSMGVVQAFVEFVRRQDYPPLQFEAAWALTNIASGPPEHTEALVNLGAVPVLMSVLSAATNDEVREQAVWALGNIIGDGVQCRDVVLDAGALPVLLELANAEQCTVNMLRQATWAVSNLCRGKPQPPWTVIGVALPTLSHLLYSKDPVVLADALWGVSYLSEGGEERIQHFVYGGICRRVVEMLVHPHVAVQIPAVRTIGNIVTGNDLQTQTVLNCAVLPCLCALLLSDNQQVQKEACWVLSNITAGNRFQIKAVVEEPGLLKALVGLLGDPACTFKTRKEAAWAIANLCAGGTPEHIRTLVSVGCIPPLCDLLLNSDPRSILVVMDTLAYILEIGKEDAKTLGYNPFAIQVDEADGLEKLDTLQGHQHKDVWTKAQFILENYFADAEEDLPAPTMEPGTQHFAFSTAMNAPAEFHFQR